MAISGRRRGVDQKWHESGLEIVDALTFLRIVDVERFGRRKIGFIVEIPDGVNRLSVVSLAGPAG